MQASYSTQHLFATQLLHSFCGPPVMERQVCKSPASAADPPSPPIEASAPPVLPVSPPPVPALDPVDPPSAKSSLAWSMPRTELHPAAATAAPTPAASTRRDNEKPAGRRDLSIAS